MQAGKDDGCVAGWHLIFNDSVAGANVSSAFSWLDMHKIKPKKKIVVGVIDSGSDTTHLYLKDALWHNKKERDNGKDNDKNG